MDRLWDGLFLAMLALPTVLALTDPGVPRGARTTVVTLAAALVVWHLGLFNRLPQDQPYPRWPALGYWLVVATAAVVLTGLHDSFSLLLYGLYPLMFMSLGWWGVPGIAGITALLGWRADQFDDGLAGLVNVLVSSVVALAIAVFITVIARQSTSRREALEALAATRTELAAVARRAGVLEERDRLAREIHDTVAQGLVSVVTQLEAADQALPADPSTAQRHLTVARQAAREGLTDVRRSVQALRPELLEGASLEAALARLCQRWSSDTGVVARLQTGGCARPPHPESDVALLRATQEALANVARHARATAVTVALEYGDGTVRLRVTDNGVGMSPALDRVPSGVTDAGDGAGMEMTTDGDRSTGFGLLSMAERIAAVGGRLDVAATPGRGTTVAIEVPA